MTDRTADITRKLQFKIRQQLTLVITGAQSPGQVIGEIDRLLGGQARGRAITITRTKIGRVYSVATDLRLRQAVRVVPGLKKQWRRSSKLHSRIQHDLADGQVREIDQAFDIGGEQLMFPRDPTGSAKQTISCGCVSVPYKDDWEVPHPDRRAFTDREIGASSLRGDLG